MHFVRQANKTAITFSIQFFQKITIHKYNFFLHFNYFMLFHILVTTIRSCALKFRVFMSKQEIRALVVWFFPFHFLWTSMFNLSFHMNVYLYVLFVHVLMHHESMLMIIVQDLQMLFAMHSLNMQLKYHTLLKFLQYMISYCYIPYLQLLRN